MLGAGLDDLCVLSNSGYSIIFIALQYGLVQYVKCLGLGYVKRQSPLGWWYEAGLTEKQTLVCLNHAACEAILNYFTIKIFPGD